ncbi:restriction endonuclease subunit S, partial [Leptospira borgpetersenii]
PVEWKTLGQVAKRISSGGTPNTGVSEFYDGNIPWLRTQEINFEEIWDTGAKITEEGLKNSSAKWIPENCVIVAMYGATVGKIGINKIPMTTNQACANIELDENVANYRYVFHF